MAEQVDQTAIKSFREYVSELAATWYEGDETKAFRHLAFQMVADPTLADPQVIELTAIDQPGGDLEIDGTFIDPTDGTILVFQSAGGAGKANEAKVSKFWQTPQELLNPGRSLKDRKRALGEFADTFESELKNERAIRLVFASRGGFERAALDFHKGKEVSDRPLTFPDGSTLVARCTFELLSEEDIARKFDDYRAGFRSRETDVELELSSERGYYIVDTGTTRSMRATVDAAEIVRIFKKEGMGYRLFQLNPRGPLANARVNKAIAKTLESPETRKNFHLLNNGLCATCDKFDDPQGDRVVVKNFQIVNGCQTTVTLAEQKPEALEGVLVDLKLVVADLAVAKDIAIASNSQNALRARDYASFERQQNTLQFEFDRLQPPYYYEIKQGYWRVVMNDPEKAKYKTGRRKRHIEVQPLAQAALAFQGFPAEALDRVRFVFEAIRGEGAKDAYKKAFPEGIRAQQLLLPWSLLDHLLHKQEGRPAYSTFHVLWLIAEMLRDKYGLTEALLFSPETSRTLYTPLNEPGSWVVVLTRIANAACRGALRRAQGIDKSLEARDFFRSESEVSPQTTCISLLREALAEELEIERERGVDPYALLPV